MAPPSKPLGNLSLPFTPNRLTTAEETTDWVSKCSDLKVLNYGSEVHDMEEDLITAPSAGNPPSLRICHIVRSATSGSCGFHLSRTQWDPYPWVSAVESGSPAEAAGLRSGDCVLEVNGEDVLGQRIGEVASRVRAKDEQVQLLLWNAGNDPNSAVTLMAGSGPTPLSLQLLSGCLQQLAALLECPVCLEPVSPPTWQCCHGHIMCTTCRTRAERCPVCRVPLGPRGRCLLADKMHDHLTQTYQRYGEQRGGNSNNQTINPTAKTQSPPDSTTRLHVASRVLRLSKSSEDVGTRVDPELLQRTGSKSAGDLLSAPKSTKSTSVDEEKPADELVHCPYGSRCSCVCLGSQIFSHIRQDHDGPLVQYFPREGCPLTVRMSKNADAPLVSLNTKSGHVFFVTVEQSNLWFWLLPPTSSDAKTSCEFALSLSLIPGQDPDPAPVFPLSTSSADILATGRCLHLDDEAIVTDLMLRLTVGR